MRTMRPIERRQRASRGLLGLVAVLVLCASLAACSDDEEGGGKDTPDIVIDRPINQGPRWETEVVDDGDAGLHPSLAIDAGGTVGIAYWTATGYEDGTCDELGADPPPPPRMRWPLKYATGAAGSWAVESIADPIILSEPPGLSFAMAPDGTPSLAVVSGEPVAQIRFCGANDLGYMRRQAPGTWSLDTAIATSGEAASGLPASDYGDVVGFWPSLAFDANGQPVIVYKDVHAGGMQSDDFRRADLEMAWGNGGGWSAIPVDMGEGAGTYNSLTFDTDGNPIVAYYTPTEDLQAAKLGVWVSRSLDAGATWEKVQLFNRGTSEGPAVAVDPESGTVYVAYYASTQGFPEVATLTNPEAFTSSADGWSLEDIGDSIYDEGYSPSIAISNHGSVAVAYYRCGRVIAGLGECTTDGDALVFAWKNGDTWEREVVDEGTDEGFCGAQPSLAFDTDGSAVIAYRCEQLVDGAVTSILKVARREPM